MYSYTTPIEVTAKTKMTIEVTDAEAFHILCKAAGMEFIHDDEHDYYPRYFDDDETRCVCFLDNEGKEHVASEHGELFIALCNVAVQMFPNVEFRSANYIYKPWNESQVAYLCDKKYCYGGCKNPDCHHVMDIEHAKNFEYLGEGKWMEKE